MDLLRELFSTLDWAVYLLVEKCLRLILDLSEVQIFSDSVIHEFSTRIYVILGLVMVFKLSISFIQYLIEPDKVDDKEQGMAGILKRVIISLLLIVLVPTIFDTAIRLQKEILPMIPRLILGIEAESMSEDSFADNTSRSMAYYTFMAFFNYSAGNENLNTILSPTMDDTTNVSIWSISTAGEHVLDRCNGDYCYDYLFLVSTAAGAYLVYVLVSVAVNIAIRAFKLGICELIAPIPIASYIDPKTSKQSFSNWVSISIKTYFDLFINLIVVWFVIYAFDMIITTVSEMNLSEQFGNDFWRIGFVIVLLIVGLLQFAKQAPKFLCDLIGIKDSGSGMGDMFKRAGNMFATTVGTGLVGSKAARLARVKSKEAGESEEVQRYRARMAAMNARGRFIADRIRGKKYKESSSGAVDKVLTSTGHGIQRTAGYTRPGTRASMSDVRIAQRGYISAKTRSYLGQSQEIETLDARLDNFKKVSDMVSNGRKSMAGHKLAKAYVERYEAIKNTSEEVYQQQIRNSLSRQIAQLEDEYTDPSRVLSNERRTEIIDELTGLNERLVNDAEIRSEARELKFRETNDASRAVDDVQKRLFAFAMNGNTEENYNSILNDEDRRIWEQSLGFDRQKLWNDGEIIETTRTATLSTQTAINNAMLVDTELRDAYGGAINIESMDVNAAGTLKDRSNRMKSDLENSPEYFEKKANAVGFGGKSGNDQ